jgi:hypothetical protein
VGTTVEKRGCRRYDKPTVAVRRIEFRIVSLSGILLTPWV